MAALSEKKILLVEDEALIAEMVGDMLVDLGATLIGPATTLDEALSLAQTEGIDAAVLDINLRGERIDAVARLLTAKGIPVVFATGYGTAAGNYRQSAPVIDKPYTQERLASALLRVLTDPEAVDSQADR